MSFTTNTLEVKNNTESPENPKTNEDCFERAGTDTDNHVNDFGLDYKDEYRLFTNLYNKCVSTLPKKTITQFI